jgi:hypothetical protein
MGISINKLNICDIVQPLYYSGFALTDNKSFIEFHLKKFPKLNQTFKEFVFTEDSISFEIGAGIIPEEQKKNILFDNFILDNKLLYHYFIAKYKEVQFYWFNKWLGKKGTGLIAIVKDGKLIGLLKTRKRRLSDGYQEQDKRKGKEIVFKRKISSKEE